MLGLQSNAAEVFQQVGQEYGEAHTGRAVDDTVVKGQAQWAHQARSEFFAVPNRFDLGFAHAQDGDFGSVHNRRETCAADAAQAGNGKHAPCISCGLSLPSRAFLDNSVSSWLICFKPF